MAAFGHHWPFRAFPAALHAGQVLRPTAIGRTKKTDLGQRSRKMCASRLSRFVPFIPFIRYLIQRFYHRGLTLRFLIIVSDPI